MKAFELTCVLLSVLCVLWAQCRWMAGNMVSGKWRATPHYVPLWIAISLPAYLSALWPVWRALP